MGTELGWHKLGVCDIGTGLAQVLWVEIGVWLLLYSVLCVC